MYNYDSDIISPEELCEWLMIGRTTASRLLNSGDIKCFKINRIWKIPSSGVIDYIKEKSGIIPYEPQKFPEHTD